MHPPSAPMFDTICSLPLSADIFAQTLHPSLPILTVGLSSGHVQTFRLPSLDPSSTSPATPNDQLARDISASITSKPSPSSTRSKPYLPPAFTPAYRRRTSETGFDTVDTAWRTRRHKGSCRALAFSHDGSTLFSAGSDGIVKAADAATGRVVGKVAIGREGGGEELDAASVLVALSPVNVVLGTDEGGVLVYDLREAGADVAGVGAGRWTPGVRPARAMRPHRTEADPAFVEAITSLSLLPPTAASTSGTSRCWVSTAGSSLACVDLRKGVVGVSEDQGDVLLSSACVGASRVGAGKRKAHNLGGEGGGERVLVGGAGGVVTTWERGHWADQVGRIMVQKDEGNVQSEGTVDVMCTLPAGVKINGREAGYDVVAAGLGNGLIKFVRVRGRGGEVIGSVGHDELRFEGVTTLGFDVEGRMVSGGGSVVKIWKERVASEVAEDKDEDEEEDLEETIQMGDGSDEEDSEDSSEEEKPKRKKKKRKGTMSNGANSRFGQHGVVAIPGLD